MSSLSQQALKGASWIFLRRGGRQIIRFFVTVILARILLPEDFGLVAILGVFIAVSEKFIYAGFGEALIQKKEVSQTDFSTLFWYNLVVACAGYLALFLVAPWIAAFFEQPELIAILRVTALGLICTGFEVVQTVQFTRRMDFKTPTVVSLLALCASAVTGITMALHGFGVWSLVWAGLVARGLGPIIFWLVNRWRPSLRFSFKSIREISRFGIPVLATSLLEAIFVNINAIIIGKSYSAVDLGYYNRGRAIETIVVQTTNNPLQQVLFPSFSRIKDDPSRMVAAYLRSLRIVAFLIFPVLFSLAACAESLILGVYSEKWIASVPYLYWLALIGAWKPLTLVGIALIKGAGKMTGFFRLQLVRYALIAVALSLTFRMGIEPMIIGSGVAFFLFFIVISGWLKKLLSISVIDIMKAIFPPLGIASVAHVVALWTPFPIDPPAIVEALSRFAVFMAIYAAGAIVFRLNGLSEILTLTRNFWGPFKWARNTLSWLARGR